MRTRRERANEETGPVVRTGSVFRLATAALLVLGAVGSSLAAPGQAPRPCRIVTVHDAATLTLRCDGRDHVVRLSRLRAPRLPSLAGDPRGEPFAARSRELAEAWLRGRDVELRAGVVLLDGSDLRRELLTRGLVQLEGPIEITPAGPAGPDPLRSAERDARAQRRGVWSHDAWLAHRSSATDPVPLPSPPPPPSRPALGALAARPGRPSWEERKAAFDAAVAELERKAGTTGAADGKGSAPSSPQRP